MEASSLFYLRTETYPRFDPYHRTGGNLIPILSKDRNLSPVRSLSPNRWKPNPYFIYGQKPIPSSILIIGKVETSSLFYLRTETCPRFDPYHRIVGNLVPILSKDKNLSRFDPYHRTGGNLIPILSDRNLFPVQSLSSDRWKINLDLYLIRK